MIEQKERPIRWSGWVQAGPSLAPIIVLVLLWTMTATVGLYASAENCGAGPRTECGLTPVVTLAAAAVCLVLLSPWLASWWARRVRARRQQQRDARLGGPRAQLRDWFANRRISAETFRDYRDRIEATIVGGRGETAYAVGQFLQAWATLLAFGGLVFLTVGAAFVLSAEDDSVLAFAIGTLGTVTIATIGVSIALALGGAAMRRSGAASVQEAAFALEADLDELALTLGYRAAGRRGRK